MGPKIAALTVAHPASPPAQTTGGTFCDIAKPIRLSHEAIAAMSDQEVADALAHDRKGAKALRMEAMSDQPSIADALRELWSQISVLAVSGLAGAAFRAILAPERKWNAGSSRAPAAPSRRSFSAACSAICSINLTGAGFYAYSAAGFIMGSGGESAVKALQDRILGADK